MESKIEVPRSKTKSLIPIIFLLSVSVIGIMLFISPESYITNISKNTNYISTIGVVAAGISLILAIINIRKLFTQKTGLILNKEGITDNSNASFTQLIKWSDITKVEAKKSGPINLIIIHIDNPEKYISKAKKTSIRQMRKNLSLFGSPVLIVSSRLKIKFPDLKVLIMKEFEKAKQISSPNKTT